MTRVISAIFAALLAVCLLPASAAADQQWLVVSDLHVLPFDESPFPTDYGSDSNWALVKAVVAQMRRAEPNAPVILLAGDMLAHRFPALVSSHRGVSVPQEAEIVMRRLAQIFGAAFPHAQFFIVMGNNDDPCGDYRSTPGSAYLKAVAKIWAPLVNRRGLAPSFQHDFAAGAYYSARVQGARFRLIALNSVYWSILYRNACGTSRRNPESDELSWFERTLARRGAPGVVLMHIPPGVDAKATLEVHRFLIVPFLQAGTQDRFLRDLARSPSVATVFAGHLHRADYRIFAGTPFVIVPSVSPVYRNDPAFLDVRMGSEGIVRDAVLYGYNPRFERWEARLDFDKLFGTPNLDAASLRALDTRLAGDDDLRDVWARFYSTGSRYIEIRPATWRSYWCAHTASGTAYITCAGDRSRIASVLLLAGMIALAAAAGLIAWRRHARR